MVFHGPGSGGNMDHADDFAARKISIAQDPGGTAMVCPAHGRGHLFAIQARWSTAVPVAGLRMDSIEVGLSSCWRGRQQLPGARARRLFRPLPPMQLAPAAVIAGVFNHHVTLDVAAARKGCLCARRSSTWEPEPDRPASGLLRQLQSSVCFCGLRRWLCRLPSAACRHSFPVCRPPLSHGRQ